MPIVRLKFIKRSDLREHKDWLFLFGDNLQRKGRGGQAREMRGEPNAVGIITKRLPTYDNDAFLRDSDFEWWSMVIEADFANLRAFLKLGGVLVIPEDGLGTGLADMPHACPKLFAHLQAKLQELETL